MQKKKKNNTLLRDQLKQMDLILISKCEGKFIQQKYRQANKQKQKTGITKVASMLTNEAEIFPCTF